MKIYTKRGDYGNTNLIGGRTVKKNDRRIQVIGEVDELNAALGMLIALIKEDTALEADYIQNLTAVQHHLFDIGSILADKENKLNLTFSEETTQQVEKQIDWFSSNLPTIDYFILPGGNKAAAQAHVVRTIVRRVERNLIDLSLNEKIPHPVLIYMNRLSDYFFVLARYINLQLQYEETFYTNTGKVFHNKD